VETAERLEAIDQFRGFAIIMMALANYLGGVHIVPWWLKHAEDVGLTFIDLVAPFFIFAIGLTYRPSAERRIARSGWWRTVEHFSKRFLALLGLGALISAAEIWAGASPRGIAWGVLQAIGVAGLVTLAVIRLSRGVRLVVGLALLGAYQVLLDRHWLQVVLQSPHGGIQGSLAWSAMLILATVLADLFHDLPQGRKMYPYSAILTLLAGIALSVLVPVSKNRVSASYVLISLGVSGLLFWGFHLLAGRLHFTIPLLSAWGRNPLLLYFLHYLVIGIYVLPGIPVWHTDAPAWLVALQALGMIAVLSGVAWFLRARDLIFSL